MKKILIFKKILFILGFVFLLSGCATTKYFPLKKDSYFSGYKYAKKKVFLMPFSVNAFTIITKFHTMEQLHKKEKEAQEYFYNAFNKILAEKNYEIIGYISMDDIKKEDFDQDQLTIISELWAEFNSADYSIYKNLKEDKDKPLDYSIGLIAQEFRERLKQKPDIFLFIRPAGFIADLGALNKVTSTAMGIITLGLYFLNPTPDDTTGIDSIFVDATSGDIIWYNSSFYLGRSLLLSSQIEDAVKKNLLELPNATGQ